MGKEKPATNREKLERALASTKFSAEGWSEAGSRGMRMRTPEGFSREKFKERWKRGNEERMINSLKRWGRFGGMTMKILFLLKDDDEKFRTLSGKTVVVRKIPSQGKLMEIVDGLIAGVVEEARK